MGELALSVVEEDHQVTRVLAVVEHAFQQVPKGVQGRVFDVSWAPPLVLLRLSRRNLVLVHGAARRTLTGT